MWSVAGAMGLLKLVRGLLEPPWGAFVASMWDVKLLCRMFQPLHGLQQPLILAPISKVEDEDEDEDLRQGISSRKTHNIFHSLVKIRKLTCSTRKLY